MPDNILGSALFRVGSNIFNNYLKKNSIGSLKIFSLNSGSIGWYATPISIRPSSRIFFLETDKVRVPFVTGILNDLILYTVSFIWFNNSSLVTLLCSNSSCMLVSLMFINICCQTISTWEILIRSDWLPDNIGVWTVLRNSVKTKNPRRGWSRVSCCISLKSPTLLQVTGFCK